MRRALIPAVLLVLSLSPAAATAQDDLFIRGAIAALPPEFRETATVLGYPADAAGVLRTLRRADGPYICLADDPSEERFHVACYHRSLEPFMARGRELRASGVRGASVDSARYAEIDSGRLPMPDQPATLYSLTAASGQPDATTGVVPGSRPLYVIYIPFATAESTGLPTSAPNGSPWIMFPGTPKAHIMFVPQM